MNEQKKTALMAAAVVLLLILVGYIGYNSLRDKSEPTTSPKYLQMSPEERAKIRAEGLARRNGRFPGGAPPPGSATK